MHASTTYAFSSSRRRLSTASSLAVDTQRPWAGRRGPNTYVTSRSSCSSQIGHGVLGRRPDVLGRPDQLGVRVAHLVLAQPATAVLVDEMLAREAMVDLAARAPHPRSTPIDIDISAQGSPCGAMAAARSTRDADETAGIPIGRSRTDHTGSVSNIVTEQVKYGEGIPSDDELGLIGDVSSGARVIELGIVDNAIALAQLGAKAIAVDPDPGRISELRLAANDAEVSVECHQGDLGDLGFAPSGTIDVVVSVHTLDLVDDLGRILRQVHRVLKPGAPFVLVLDHPFASVGPTPRARSGATARTGARSPTCSPRSTARTSASRCSTSWASAANRPCRPRSSIKVRKLGS